MKYAVRRRKRIVSLVLGLVLILGSAVGPFAMGATVAEGEGGAGVLNPSISSISLSGSEGNSIIVDSPTTFNMTVYASDIKSLRVVFMEEGHPENETITTEYADASTEPTTPGLFSLTASVDSNVKNTAHLIKRIDYVDLNGESGDFTRASEYPAIISTGIMVSVNIPPARPTITSITLDNKSEGISYSANQAANAQAKVTFSDNTLSYVASGAVQKKNGDNYESLTNYNFNFVKEADGNNYVGTLNLPTETGEYRVLVSATYGNESISLDSKDISFSITAPGQSGDPNKPTMTVHFNSSQSNRVFKQDEKVTLSATFKDGELAKISSVNYTIKKGGNAVTDHNNVSLMKGTTGFSREITIPGTIGEDYTLEVSATSLEGTPNPDSPTPVQFSVVSKVSENPHSIVFTSVKFSNNAQEIGSIAPGRELNFSAVITSSHEITNAQAIVFNASGNGVGNPVILTKGTDNLYTGKITTPENVGFYGITLSATANGETVNNTALSFNVVRENPVDTLLRLKVELTSNSLVGNSNGQIFTEGGTVKVTITSENANARFTNNSITAWISANNGTPNTSITLNKITSGTYANRRYEGTFTAGVPLASNFYYTITNAEFPYTIVGGTGGIVPPEPVAYTTASNKPYIRTGNLTAMYSASSNSNVGVSPGSLIEGNVITYEAKLDNYSGVNSVNLEFTNRSGMTGYNINIPLSKVNSTGLFRGKYTITRNNTGFTYDLNKITYKTSSGSTSYDMDNYPIYGHAFTVSNHQHTFGGAYQYNSEEHWQNSTCNAEHPGQIIMGNRAKHSYTSAIITPATQTTAGTRRYTCTVCGYTYNATIPATGTALSATTIDTIRNMANGTRAIIAFGSDYVISSDVFSALRGTTKEVEFQSNNKVSWIFRGQDITGTAKAININTEISSAQSNTSPYASYIRNLVGKQPTVIIDFAANGNLPGRATVRVPLNTAMLNALGGNKTGLKVQYYNAATNRLEDVANNVSVFGSGNNSYVEFAITHNSSYIITKEGSQSGNTNSGGTNNNTNSGNTNNTTNSGNTNNTTNSGNTNVNSGNKKPTTTTTVINRVIHKVSPKTMDGGYGMLWVAMFMVGVLLVISSLCMTKLEE